MVAMSSSASCGGSAGSDQIVWGSSLGNGFGMSVSTVEGRTVLQPGQGRPLSDASLPHAGHFISKERPQEISTAEIMWLHREISKPNPAVENLEADATKTKTPLTGTRKQPRYRAQDCHVTCTPLIEMKPPARIRRHGRSHSPIALVDIIEKSETFSDFRHESISS